MKSEITSYYIYPAIGIARVGNSKTEYYIGPETPNQAIEEGVKYKDKHGKVKRQVARFRIYGMDSSGKVVKEITQGDGCDIKWQVHLANRKAINYQFNNAMDLGKLAIDSELRNGDITNLKERHKKLLIDPGSRKIAGRNKKNKPKYCFDSGEFYKGTKYQRNVYLGELQTDKKGRLLVFGGRGHSASYNGKKAITFANNDGWHDDVSDGTVRATITLNGKKHVAKPAMVAITPPNFAPGIRGTVTMYDVVMNMFYQEKLLTPPTEVYFYTDIYPVLKSLVDNQAVNSGFYMMFGVNAPADFSQPELLAKLSSPDEANKNLRQYLFKQFRKPVPLLDEQRKKLLHELKESKKDKNLAQGLQKNIANTLNDALEATQYQLEADKQPPFYGDTFGDYPDSLLSNLSLTDFQYLQLKKWADGNFITDSSPEFSESLDDLPLSEQPSALTQTNLLECLGGPFHPGIELTWFLRLKSMWNIKDPIDKLRLNILPADQPVKDFYGPILTPEIALSEMFNNSGPGCLTRFMGVPWQTDEASCRSAQDYDPAFYLPTPSFWSARVPNQVLSHRSFERINDENLPFLQRLKHLDYRQDWLRFFNGPYLTQINDMVENWDKIGIVTKQAVNNLGTGDDSIKTLWVESEVNPKYTVNDPSYRQLLHMENLHNIVNPLPESAKSQSDFANQLRNLETQDIDAIKDNIPKRRTKSRQDLL